MKIFYGCLGDDGCFGWVGLVGHFFYGWTGVGGGIFCVSRGGHSF